MAMLSNFDLIRRVRLFSMLTPEQAQTVANTYLAMERGLTILPVINKIDLPNAAVEEVRGQIEDILAIGAEDAFLVSAKTGQGVPELLEAVARLGRRVGRWFASAGREDF